MSAPAVESRADFAARIGVNKSTVTRWAQAGRLVLADDGAVDIDASIQRLDATRGIRHDVAERWRQYRDGLIDFEGNPIQPQQPPATPAVADDDTPLADDLDRDEIGRRTRLAQMLKEEANARIKAREDEAAAGRYLERDRVQSDLLTVANTVNGLLDQIPDRLAPLFPDAEHARALLRDDIHQTRHEIADALERIAGRGTTPAHGGPDHV
jgi:hypothetical protein